MFGKITPKEEPGKICSSCRKHIVYIKEPRCMKCGKPVSSVEQEFCYDCSRYNYAYDQGRSLWLHSGEAAAAIYQMKFHNKRCYAAVFAQEMAVRYGEWIRRNFVEEIIPVPLHKSRKKARGFNQAELLAEELGRIMEIPVNKKVVFRIRNTKPQKFLDDRQRQDNLKDAFGVSRTWNVKEKVLLIDDIYTTGNTIHRISSLLKRVGVQKVYFLTISIGQGL